MGVAQHTVITCDRVVKGKPCGQPADTFTVTFNEQSWDVDLCEAHTFWHQVIVEGRVHQPALARRTQRVTTKPWMPDRK